MSSPARLEALVGGHAQVDEERAVGPAPRPGRPPLGQAEGRPVLHPGWHLDHEAAVLHAPALAPAVGARVGDRLAHPLAAAAGHRGDHLAEQGLADAADLAGPLAVGAVHRLGARAWPPTPWQVSQVTGRRTASSRRAPKAASAKVSCRATSASAPGWGPRRRPRPAAAGHGPEEGLEQVAQAAVEVEPGPRPRPGRSWPARTVVAGPALGVAQHLVGEGDLLELLLGLRVARCWRRGGAPAPVRR